MIFIIFLCKLLKNKHLQKYTLKKMWIKHRSVKNTFFEMYLHFLEVRGAYFASSHRKFFKNLHNRIYLAIFAKIFISTIINLIKK